MFTRLGKNQSHVASALPELHFPALFQGFAASRTAWLWAGEESIAELALRRGRPETWASAGGTRTGGMSLAWVHLAWHRC